MMFSLSGVGQNTQRPEVPSLWVRQTQEDLRQIEGLMRTRYIYGVYEGDPGYPHYFAVLAEAERRARTEALKARSPLDYQFVIKHFLASFDDPHISAEFTTIPSFYQWPGFLMVYRGHQYRVAGSTLSNVIDGSVVDGCDSDTDFDLIKRVAATSRGGAYDESEKAWYAVVAMVFTRNSYEKPPAFCRIGGQKVSMHWQDISFQEMRSRQAPFRPKSSDEFSISSFAEGTGSWVRLPSFEVQGSDAVAFNRIIADAPSLRSKKLIVIDLRGNGGGPYQWFMGFLRALYGAPFTDFCARERLKIQGVYLDLGRSNSGGLSDGSSIVVDAQRPHDPVLESTEDHFTTFLGRYGQRLERSQRVPANLREDPTGPAPANPVLGDVVVLTDHGSASAVNSFLDEVKHFPNVTQVGTEPLPDRRSGSPMPYELTSGNGTVYLPYMTRDFRSRNDNQEHVPTFLYKGDIRQTEEVMKWIETLTLDLTRNERTGAVSQ